MSRGADSAIRPPSLGSEYLLFIRLCNLLIFLSVGLLPIVLSPPLASFTSLTPPQIPPSGGDLRRKNTCLDCCGGSAIRKRLRSPVARSCRIATGLSLGFQLFTFSLLERHLPEKLGTVEIGFLRPDRLPREEMGVREFVAAFVEVHAGLRDRSSRSAHGGKAPAGGWPA